jgi:hypothetical protein
VAAVPGDVSPTPWGGGKGKTEANVVKATEYLRMMKWK